MKVQVSFLLILSACLMPSSISAQWGRRFTIAAGPALSVDHTPPNAGVHLRSSVVIHPGPRTLNLLVDGYVTRLLPGSKTFADLSGSLELRREETQIGRGLGGLLTFLSQRRVSPFLLLGGVYRHTDGEQRAMLRDAAGQTVDDFTSDVSANQLDILVGAGFAFRWGTRRLLLEARAYGGMARYVPVTLGLSF